jgi:hypothetical protein
MRFDGALLMINVCLDWNCVIALEEERNSAPALREIRKWYKQSKIELCISSPSRLENPQSRDRRVIGENEWSEKLRNVGLEGIELHPSGRRSFSDVHGVHHWDFGVEQILMREVHVRLFPKIDFLWRDYARNQNIDLSDPPDLFSLQEECEQESEEQRNLGRKWNNKKNDALSIYTFGTWSGPDDVFVTDDNDDLLKKRARLRAPYEITRSVLWEVPGNGGERILQERVVTQTFHNVIQGNILSPQEAAEHLRKQLRI